MGWMKDLEIDRIMNFDNIWQQNFFAGYDGKFGSVARQASQDREEFERTTGVLSKRAEAVLQALENNGYGATWKELGQQLNLHHGQISGILSNLHKKGFVFCSRWKRPEFNAHPYFHHKYRNDIPSDERIDFPAQTTAGKRKQAIDKFVAEIRTSQNMAQVYCAIQDLDDKLDNI